jgi:hypothetical protein
VCLKAFRPCATVEALSRAGRKRRKEIKEEVKRGG